MHGECLLGCEGFAVLGVPAEIRFSPLARFGVSEPLLASNPLSPTPRWAAVAERVGWLLRRSAVHRWRGSAHPNPAGFEPALLRAPCEGLAERVGSIPS